MAELINEKDSLNEGRKKLNEAIKDSNKAKIDSSEAKTKAEQALSKSESTQEQLNQVVIEGDSSVEAAQARVDEKGQTHATLKDRIDDGFTKVNTKLAETINKRTKTLVNGKSKAMVSFIDDDGRKEVVTRLAPIFYAKGVKGNLAIITGDLGESHRITLEELKELNKNGFEVLSHTVNHVNLSTYNGNESLIEMELRDSKQQLQEWGFDVKGIVYPNNYQDEQIRRMSQKYYDFATGGIGLNTDYNIVNSYGIKRIAFGSYTDANPSVRGNDEQDTLEYYKLCVDEAIENNQWLVFMIHIIAQDVSYDVMLGELIDYIKSKNVEIVHMSEGFENFGSRLFAGDIESEFTAVDKDGTLRFPYRVKKGAVDGVYMDDLITSFEPETITSHIIRAPHAVANNFPSSEPGVLYTHYLDKNFQRYNFQQYHDSRGDVYIRHCKDDSGLLWDKWALSNGAKRYASNTFTGNTPIADYPLGISMCYLWGSNTTGLPNNVSGIITTYRNSSNSADYQIFKQAGSVATYIRTTDSSGNWKEWEQTNYMQFDDTINYWTSANNLKEGLTVTYIPQSYSQISRMPEGTSGLLLSYKVGTVTHQEYHVDGKFHIYKRIWEGSWGDFIPITPIALTTNERPARPYVGLSYFDTTLGKPVWCKTEAIIVDGNITTQAVWVDATGTTVIGG